jgi:hypothetical protein
MTPFKFNVGDQVTKSNGYEFPGVVVARFHTTRGDVRYVVECVVEQVKGMLHIYNETQLEHAKH